MKKIPPNLTNGLKILPLKYVQNPIIDQVSINSIRSKSELLVPQISSNIDVLMISVAKSEKIFKLPKF